MAAAIPWLVGGAGGAGGAAAGPSLAAQIGGALFGGLFGKKKSSGGGVDSRTKKSYDTRWNIYNSTNFDKLVKDSIKSRTEQHQATAMDTLQNYDALQAGKGSPIFSADSRKDSARTQIASNAGRDAATYAADLLFRSPWLKQSLVPDLQGGVQTPARTTDNSQQMMALAPILGQLFDQWF